MKRILIATLTAAAVLISLCSCQGKDNQETTSSVTETEATESLTSTVSAENTAYEDVYAELIGLIRTVISEHREDNEYIPDDDLEAVYCTSLGYGDKALSEMGYTIKDINGDDVPELLVICRDSNEKADKGSQIIAAYSCANDEVSLIFSAYYRSSYRYMRGNKLYYSGSASAFSHAFGTYELSTDGKTLTCLDFYFSDLKDGSESDTGYYRNNTGEFDTENSRELDITDDEFWEMEEKLEKQALALEYIPFDVDTETAKTANSARITAQYLKDAQGDYSNAERLEADNSEYAVEVLITADSTVTDFKLLSLSLNENSDSVQFSQKVISSFESIGPGSPVVLLVSFPGSVPQYGISYTDTNGKTVEYSLSQSGEDGSIVLSEIS